MQERNFCTVLELLVVNGEPILSPPPRVILQIKFSRQNDPRPEMALEDFALTKEQAGFFEYLNRFGNGRIARLVIKDGQPFLMDVEELAQP